VESVVVDSAAPRLLPRRSGNVATPATAPLPAPIRIKVRRSIRSNAILGPSVIVDSHNARF
jgi:hypothetical protein